ncbi:MAG: Flp pilus assembly protein CpaB [Actinobacteria bacterium]|nr:Flp pilus assembly protein CpaB [Actinomycetota bacterium]
MSLIYKQKLFGIIFIIVAVFGGIFIFWYINNLKSQNNESSNSMEIFVASNDINSGQVIEDNSVSIEKIPLNIFNEKFITNLDQIAGKKALTSISKGEIISKDKIEGNQLNENPYIKFSSYIPEGLRAVSVPVNYYGDDSVLKAGDKVDVISVYYDQISSQLIPELVLGEKEIVMISNQKNPAGKKAGDQANADKNDSLLANNIFDSSYTTQALSSSIIVTFYLTISEEEKIFLSLERGVLNLSICPEVKNMGF